MKTIYNLLQKAPGTSYMFEDHLTFCTETLQGYETR